MCNKLITKGRHHVHEGGIKIGKTLAVIALFCLSECTAGFKKNIRQGSCLKYGHSCWGAHGKRNDGSFNHLSENDPPNNNLPNDMKWFLQKLLQANDYSSSKGRDSLPRNIRILLKEISSDDNLKSNEDNESVEDQSDMEKIFMNTGDKSLGLNDAERNFFKFLRNN